MPFGLTNALEGGGGNKVRRYGDKIYKYRREKKGGDGGGRLSSHPHT